MISNCVRMIMHIYIEEQNAAFHIFPPSSPLGSSRCARLLALSSLAGALRQIRIRTMKDKETFQKKHEIGATRSIKCPRTRTSSHHKKWKLNPS